jgi:hypothetical protein
MTVEFILRSREARLFFNPEQKACPEVLKGTKETKKTKRTKRTKETRNPPLAPPPHIPSHP